MTQQKASAPTAELVQNGLFLEANGAGWTATNVSFKEESPYYPVFVAQSGNAPHLRQSLGILEIGFYDILWVGTYEADREYKEDKEKFPPFRGAIYNNPSQPYWRPAEGVVRFEFAANERAEYFVAFEALAGTGSLLQVSVKPQVRSKPAD